MIAAALAGSASASQCLLALYCSVRAASPLLRPHPNVFDVLQ